MTTRWPGRARRRLQPGLTSNFPPISIGRKWRFHDCAQFFRGSRLIVILAGRGSSPNWRNRARPSFNSAASARRVRGNRFTYDVTATAAVLSLRNTDGGGWTVRSRSWATASSPSAPVKMDTCHIRGPAYASLASAAWTAWKLGRSFGVGVCSAYCTTPCLSMTNAARAAVSPMPARLGKSTS